MKQHFFIRCGKTSMTALGGMFSNYFPGSMKPLKCGSSFRKGQTEAPFYYIVIGNRT